MRTTYCDANNTIRAGQGFDRALNCDAKNTIRARQGFDRAGPQHCANNFKKSSTNREGVAAI
jgi:hypothetical protein